jgi:type I restriction enzyme R subunit
MKLIQEAVKPPAARLRICCRAAQDHEQVIDTVSGRTHRASFDADALDKARGGGLEQFITEHRTNHAQVLTWSGARLRYEDVRSWPRRSTSRRTSAAIAALQAYAALDAGKVKGAGAKRILTDLVSLVRFAMHQENELVPYPEKVQVNFRAWIEQQQASGRRFSGEQRKWLEMIRDHIAANLQIETEDFEYAPFAQAGGIGKGGSYSGMSCSGCSMN